MTHWGWYWKVKKQHKAKGLCDFKFSIDSFDLLRSKDFKGFVIDKGLESEIDAEMKGLSLKVSCKVGQYDIPIERQACNFGGFRNYFRCPSCNSRMRKLYRYQCFFLCRNCLRLGYHSQSVVPSTRLAFQAKKIREKLKKKGGSLYQKPKKMRWTTFERLQNKEREFDALSCFALEKEIVQMYGVLP